MTVNAQTMLELADKVVGIQEYLPNEDDRNALGQAAHYLRKAAALRSPAIAGVETELEAQHNAQLEGLAIGLEQRGEKSAAHIIRLALNRLAALSGKPGAELGREAIARKIAEWMGYSFDDLHAHSVVERGFREWLPDGYHGGKPDLLRFADALMAHTRPKCDHPRKLGGGSVGENGSWSSYWTCQDCGASESQGSAAVSRPESETP